MRGDARGSARTWALVWRALRNASLAATALLGSCCRMGPACHPATASATTVATCTSLGTSLHSILATTGAGGTGDGAWGVPPTFTSCLLPLPTAPVWPGRWCAAQRPAQVALSGSYREEGVLLVPGGLGAVTPRVSPVPCTWSNWTAWSTCSHSCDVGMRRRYRVPIVPPLAGGGPPCQGPSMEVEFCSLQPCRGERFPLQGPWGGSHGMGVLREGAVGWASLERVPLSRCHGVGTPREGVTGCVPWGGCP